VTAGEPEQPKIDVRLNQEEPDVGAAPGETIDAVIDEEEPTPEAEGEPVTGEDKVDKKGEPLEPEDKGDEESIEAIVEDLKRERGQS
jgi:hypothetical protein